MALVKCAYCGSQTVDKKSNDYTRYNDKNYHLKCAQLQKEKDDFAIDAGKLLVKEILFNTDDRTGLIAKCEKGGILNEVS